MNTTCMTSEGRREHSQIKCTMWMAEWRQEIKTIICALLVHITSVLGDGHGSAALHNAKMQHLKSLLMGFNLMAQLFIAEKQALYMLTSFSTFMLEELCLCNWTAPPVSHDNRIWKGTLKGFGYGCLHPVRVGNRHQALHLCQFTSSFIHASNTTNILSF